MHMLLSNHPARSWAVQVYFDAFRLDHDHVRMAGERQDAHANSP